MLTIRLPKLKPHITAKIWTTTVNTQWVLGSGLDKYGCCDNLLWNRLNANTPLTTTAHNILMIIKI